ncbi:hypothetical protein AWN90_05930 [Nocardia terpenica]|uniref:Uncharacterized protein n=1 Tax=Nocardia terpenica TaxID=455432 RepID=A0A164J708_9NOCA|nr:hypothetical protein AWN90_05930 [Nocardia terpenica]
MGGGRGDHEVLHPELFDAQTGLIDAAADESKITIATMELINRPDAWTILYADSATEGIATLHLGGRPLRVQVSAVLRSDARRSPILETLLAALHNS